MKEHHLGEFVNFSKHLKQTQNKRNTGACKIIVVHMNSNFIFSHQLEKPFVKQELYI